MAQASTATQRMQKALIEMNVQLTNVLSDLSGLSGMTILQAILDGERDPRQLAELAHPRVEASKADIAKSLHGNWRDELLFVLRQEMQLYQGYQDKMAECDSKVQEQLQRMGAKVDLQAQPIGPRTKRRKAQGNAPKFDLSSRKHSTSNPSPNRTDFGHDYRSQHFTLDVTRTHARAGYH